MSYDLQTARWRGATHYVDEVITDPRAEDRKRYQECRLCFYRSGMEGQAFTEYTCRKCGKQDMHANTATPQLCRECAGDVFCRRCGGDQNWQPSAKKTQAVV